MRLAGAVLVTWLMWLAIGPLAVLALVGLLFAGRVRRQLRPTWDWRWAGGLVGAAALVGGVIVLLPDGRLPIPTGGGLLVSPKYLGRPATAQPVETAGTHQNPHLAVNGRSSMHNDAAATDAYAGPGPLGREPEVRTAWYGVQECATLAFDSRDRLVALCGDLTGPTLAVIDPETLRPQDTMDLPDRPASKTGKRPWEDLCAGAYFYLDDLDRAVLATTDRRILAVRTSDGAGDPDLTVERTWDLGEHVPADDCLIALMPDQAGRIWWVTQDGLVGNVAPARGVVHAYDLQTEIGNSFATGPDGGVYVVSTQALYRFDADPTGRPQVTWRAPYDRGRRHKPGQLGQGSGTTPTLLDNGDVVIADNADPRMHVVSYDGATGREKCKVAVLGEDHGATDNSLVAIGNAVIVENNYGYQSPVSTMFGRTTEPGIARVDLDTCTEAWTADLSAPTSVPKASLLTGLVYAYTKRTSWWGVNAWYLTAVDVRTGRMAFGVRTGTGTLMNNHYAAITLGPDGAAYIATLAGLVRVRDGATP